MRLILMMRAVTSFIEDLKIFFCKNRKPKPAFVTLKRRV